jgi:hypothetical protein
MAMTQPSQIGNMFPLCRPVAFLPPAARGFSELGRMETRASRTPSSSRSVIQHLAWRNPVAPHRAMAASGAPVLPPNKGSPTRSRLVASRSRRASEFGCPDERARRRCGWRVPPDAQTRHTPPLWLRRYRR